MDFYVDDENFKSQAIYYTLRYFIYKAMRGKISIENFSENMDVRGEYIYTGSGIFHNFTTLQSNQFDIDFVYKIDYFF